MSECRTLFHIRNTDGLFLSYFGMWSTHWVDDPTQSISFEELSMVKSYMDFVTQCSPIDMEIAEVVHSN